MILTVGGVKGGTGKTTLATNFTIMRSLAGKDVLLVDADWQGTSKDFTALRETERQGSAGYTCVVLSGLTLKHQVNRQQSKYDDVVMDVGGKDSVTLRAALSVTDTFLTPFIPRTFDLWTIQSLLDAVEEALPVNEKLRVLVMLNRLDSFGTNNEEAAAMLTEEIASRDLHCITFLKQGLGTRVAFGNAAARGQGIAEVRPRDKKGVTEMEALYTAVFAEQSKEN